MSSRPSVKGLTLERAAHDFLLTLAFDKLFERFGSLRVASIENGSGFLGPLLRQLENAKVRNPWHFDEDPVALFREHVWINPFWEDDIAEVIDLAGPERVIFGSDWPHMEGLPDPAAIEGEIADLDERTRALFLAENTRALNQH